MSAPARKTELLPFDASSLARAVEVLGAGGLVAFPTETVYGLGARADRAEAVARIFEAKGRPSSNPLIVHVGSVEQARELAASWPHAAQILAQAFWPGPLTLVVERAPCLVPDGVTAGGPTVALRCPAHPVARALLQACPFPLAAPSANRSTGLSPTTAAHVLKDLDGRVDLVLDGGPTGDADSALGLHGLESTVVDVTMEPLRILRSGPITRAELEALGLRVLPESGEAHSEVGALARSPGQGALHYAPAVPLVLLDEEDLFSELVMRRARGEKVGLVQRQPGLGFKQGCELLPAEPAGYGAELYAALHRLEDQGCDVLLVADVPSDEAWSAVRDRLLRASAPR